ncbi:MAG: hypothetical protein IT457_02900 [Planctomycetes bacterium]|nr:hypothetical protein [Planctomycetota bacterium]
MSDRRRVKSEQFSVQRSGCFGSFTLKPNERQCVFHLSTVFRVADLTHLFTAKEVLRDSEIDFDTMIQRDIVPDHVEDIAQYLRSETPNVRFFPPLLAAIVPATDRAIAGSYPTSDWRVLNDNGEETLEITWGNVMRLRLAVPLANENHRASELRDATTQTRYEYLPHLASLALNPDAAKLVVVDGQHRVRAIRTLYERQPDQAIVQALTLPCCVFWAPYAVAEGPGHGKPVIEALRRVFVDVNNKAKQVSGHFRILLDDDRLVSLAIRSFCELMRREGELQFVEWNQHSDAKAYQLSSYSKIASIGIMESALLDSQASRVLSRRDNYIVQRLTRFLSGLYPESLPTPESGGSSDPTLVVDDWDSVIPSHFRRAVKESLAQVLAPTLRVLFTRLHPYRLSIELIRACAAEFREKKLEVYDLAVESLATLEESDVQSVRVARREVENQIRERLQDVEDLSMNIYRTQLFAQGYIAAFLYFVDRLLHHGSPLRPEPLAGLFVEHLNSTVFARGDTLLGPGLPWLESQVTQNGAIIKKKTTARAIARLLLAPFGRTTHASQVAAQAQTESSAALVDALKELGNDAAGAYIAEMRRSRVAAFLDGIDYDQTLDESERSALLKLRQIAGGAEESVDGMSRAQALGELQSKAEQIVMIRARPVLRDLKNALGYAPRNVAQEFGVDLGEDD